MTGQAAARPERAGMIRLLLVAGILLVEYLGLSLAFDAQVVARRGGVWALFGQAGAIGPLLVAAGAALLLIGPGLITSGLPEQRAVRLLPSLAHVASSAAFFWATKILFDGETA